MRRSLFHAPNLSACICACVHACLLTQWLTQRWWAPQVEPVEHARECICSLVDASHSFVGAIGARRPRRAAGAGLLGLAVGSFCCAAGICTHRTVLCVCELCVCSVDIDMCVGAAATKMRASPVWLPQLLRVLLALVALCGFVRLFSKHLWQVSLAHSLSLSQPFNVFVCVRARSRVRL